MASPARKVTTDGERTAKREALLSDFEYYAQHNLKIRTKDGAIKPFALNTAQRYIHQRIEEQRAKTGRVRALVLKGRQQGCSTYVEGRFYWKVTQRKGVRAFILTHDGEATDNLFEMARRFHEHSWMKPHVDLNNAKELFFDRLDSGYKVGTAGNKAVGRSSTIQYFHGSEVAYWANAAEHAKGIKQAIPDAEGTEAIEESTANGVGNYFHQQWKKAEAGESEYIAIFVPWFWQEEYRTPPPAGFALTEAETELAGQYKLDAAQICWRRKKIAELTVNGIDGEQAFQQEYPCNAAEAFQTSGGNGLILPRDVMRARKTKATGSGPLIVGVDPSRGGDRFSLIRRHGRKAYGLKSYRGHDVDILGKRVSICKQILDKRCEVANRLVDMMFIDSGGGADMVDRLHELGYEGRVTAISFAATPFNTSRYKNKRGEMWGEMQEWMTDEHLAVEVPDEDSLQADLCASPYHRDSHDRVVLLSKDEIMKLLGFSPDEGDALALTFAEPVIIHQENNYPLGRSGGRGWMAS